MDKRARLPKANFPHDPDELIRVVLFCPDLPGAIKALGVTAQQMEKWRRGTQQIPQPVFAFLKLWSRKAAPASWGEFSGLYLDDEYPMLRHSAFRHRIRFEDLADLPEMWRLKDLAKAQADTIERLMIERNFYREQCSREAKFGLMLNRIVDQ